MENLVISIDRLDVDIICGNFELSGYLEDSNTDNWEHNFIPNWFADKESELWYDQNWEEINDQVRKAVYKY